MKYDWNTPPVKRRIDDPSFSRELNDWLEQKYDLVIEGWTAGGKRTEVRVTIDIWDVAYLGELLNKILNKYEEATTGRTHRARQALRGESA